MLSKSICSVSRSAQRRRALRTIHWFRTTKKKKNGCKNNFGWHGNSNRQQRLAWWFRHHRLMFETPAWTCESWASNNFTLEAREAHQKTLRTKILGRGHGRQLAIRLRRPGHWRGVVQRCGRDKCIGVCGLSSGLALPRGLRRRPGEASLDNRNQGTYWPWLDRPGRLSTWYDFAIPFSARHASRLVHGCHARACLVQIRGRLLHKRFRGRVAYTPWGRSSTTAAC
jgi:hypothetical protein